MCMYFMSFVFLRSVCVVTAVLSIIYISSTVPTLSSQLCVLSLSLKTTVICALRTFIGAISHTSLSLIIAYASEDNILIHRGDFISGEPM
jgi:hypothetical protein